MKWRTRVFSLLVAFCFIFTSVVTMPFIGAASPSEESPVPFLKAYPRPDQNLIHLEWGMIPNTETANYNYQVLKREGGTGEFQTIPLKDTVNVLNIYPNPSPNNPTIPGTTLTDLKGNPLKKSASLKHWMTAPDGASAPNGYGKGLINVDALKIADFKNHASSYLKNGDGTWKYDVLAIGTWDSNGNEDLTQGDVDLIKQFVNQGHGLLLGHDTIGYPVGGSPKYTGTAITPKLHSLLEILHLEGPEKAPATPVNNVPDPDKFQVWYDTKVKVVRNGLLTNYPWDINHDLTIPESHTQYMNSTGDIWMAYDSINLPSGWMNSWNTTSTWNSIANRTSLAANYGITNAQTLVNYWKSHPNAQSNWYLTTWSNVAMIQTGHSNNTATSDEKKVIANALFYLAQISSGTYWDDHSAQDLEAPDPVSSYKISQREDEKYSINIVPPKDNGNSYYYKIKAILKENPNITIEPDDVVGPISYVTGVKGYAYSIDTNPNTDPGDDINLTSSNIVWGPPTTTDKYYLHIRAIDGAGNVSGVIHIEITETSTTIVNPDETWVGEGNNIYDLVTRSNDGSIVMAGQNGLYQIMQANRTLGEYGEWGKLGSTIKDLALLNTDGDVLMVGEGGYYQVLKHDNTLLPLQRWAPGTDINAAAVCGDGKVILVGQGGQFQVGAVDADGKVGGSPREWYYGGEPIYDVGLKNDTTEVAIPDSDLAAVFNYAVFSDSNLTLAGNATTNSTPVVGNGDVGTNEDIALNGSNVRVNGDVAYFGTATGAEPPKVTGTVSQLPEQIPLPELNVSEWEALAQASAQYDGDRNITGNSAQNLSQCLINGNLNLSSNSTVTIDGIIWVTGNVSLSGKCKLIGEGTIVAEGTISLAGQSQASNIGEDTTHLAFISLSTNPSQAIVLAGQASYKGIMYAPNGGINVSGQGDILGALVGNTVNAAGQGQIIYDTDIADTDIPLPQDPGTTTTVTETKSIVLGGPDGKYQVFDYSDTLASRTVSIWTAGGEERDIKAIALTTAGDSPNVFMMAGESGYYGQLDDTDAVVETYNDQWSSGVTAVDKEIYATLNLNDGSLAMVGGDGYFNVTYVKKDQKGVARKWPFSTVAATNNIYCIAQQRDSDGGGILVAGNNGYYWWVDTPVIEDFTDRVTAANRWLDPSKNMYFPNSNVISKIVITPYRENVGKYDITVYLNTGGISATGNTEVDIDLSPASIKVGYRPAGTTAITYLTYDNDAATTDEVTVNNAAKSISFSITPPADDVHPDSAKRMVVYVQYKFKKNNLAAALTKLNILNKVYAKTWKAGKDMVGAPKTNVIKVRDSKAIKYR